MKHVLHLMLIAVFSVTLCSCDKEEIITEEELPSVSREFIGTHFPNATISMIVKESEGFSHDYTVYLTNGFEIDFAKSGAWDSVDGKREAIPASILKLLPQNIQSYVERTLPGCYIVEINKEHFGFEIGLSTGIDLKFNSKGDFTGIDD